MGLNCKPGDIARIVGSQLGNNDKFVLVIQESNANGLSRGSCYRDSRGQGWTHDVDGCVWEVEALGSELHGHRRNYKFKDIGDKYLRPIRDPGDDAVDETLINNPVRHEVTA